MVLAQKSSFDLSFFSGILKKPVISVVYGITRALSSKHSPQFVAVVSGVGHFNN